ncbi:hypothetical protein HOY80DRAFT_219859 [Tuber brumale]|nr:hypothetical protein HOY80DRAFT_219859 [Tuber brumale]
MSSCRLGSWARVCAVGYLFRGGGVFFLAINPNCLRVESQFDPARNLPTRGNHPSQTLRNVTSTTGRLPYPPAFPLSFDSHTNVLG